MHEVVTFGLLGLGAGSAYALIALGLVTISKGSGVVNFAQGSIAMLAAYVYASLQGQGWNSGVALAASVGLASALGFVFYLLIMRPLLRAPVLAKVVATLGLLVVLEAFVTVFFNISAAPSAGTLLPSTPITVLGVMVPRDRLYLTAIAIGITVVLSLLYRHTKFGILTRGVSETEKGVVLLGRSPDMIAIGNWVLSFSLAGLAGVLVAQVTGLDVVSLTLLVVPALAAAVFGTFSSFWITLVAALSIGVAQSEAVNYTSVTGATDAIPFVVLIVALLLVGKSIPGRGSLATGRPPLATSAAPTWTVVPTAGVAIAGVFLLPSVYQGALVASFILAIIALSLVVITGYAGQVSLAQLTFAGVGGLLTSKFATSAGLAFPMPVILAVILTGAFGLVIGIPALRVRGINLAIVTLGAAVVIENMIFNSASLTGGLNVGSLVPNATVGSYSLGSFRHPVRFGLFILGVLAVCLLGVAWLRRSSLGRRMLAVRDNERALSSTGWSVAMTKLVAFVIAAALAGLGGALLGYQQGSVVLAQFAAFDSVLFFLIVYISGVGSIAGAVLAGLIAPGGLVPTWLGQISGAGNLQNWLNLIFGAVLLLAIVIQPDGAAAFWSKEKAKLIGWWRRRRSEESVASSTKVGLPEVDVRRANGKHGSDVARSLGETILEVVNLSVRFGGVCALEAVDLSIAEGSVTGLIGPNGAGKTTAIDAISGFVNASGQVRFLGNDISTLSPHARARLGMARTFQSLELFEDLSAYDNIAIAIRRSQEAGSEKPRSENDDVEIALEIVDGAGLGPYMPSELSMGERRIVSLARAVAARPRILMLDEPAAGLDMTERNRIAECIRALPDQGMTVLLVEHDVDLVFTTCDFVFVLNNGVGLASGSPSEVRTDPRVVASYLGTNEDTDPPPHQMSGQSHSRE